MLNRIMIIIAFFAVGVSDASDMSRYDVSKAWDKAVVYVPNQFFTKTVETVEVEKPMPVVVFLHGCGGIHDHERRWAEEIKAAGYIVVLPNSFGIPGREVNCISETSTPNIGKVPVNDLRPAEAEYAASKVKEMKWADKDNIFLMGHSEGGMGAS